MNDTLHRIPANSFIEHHKVPAGYDATMQLQWRKEWFKVTPYKDSFILVLCQKFDGAFGSVWVKIPNSE